MRVEAVNGPDSSIVTAVCIKPLPLVPIFVTPLLTLTGHFTAEVRARLTEFEVRP
jgi:hypothetical protein